MAANIDVEHDGLYLRHLLRDTGYPDIADLIKKALDSVIPRKAIDFRANVARVITQCLQSSGVPMFRTRYAKEPFPSNTVLMICYMGRLKGVWLTDTPPDDIQMLRSKADGYTLMLRKYGQYPAGSVQAGTVRLGGAATYTGQAIVSEAVDQLEYFVNGVQTLYEEFEKAWLREFPTQSVPSKPGYFRGTVDIFTITVPFKPWPEKDILALEKSLEAIEAKLKDALADEEKAVPFYEFLRNDIKNARELNPRHMPPSRIEKETDRYLYSMQEGIGDIGTQEARHKDRITNMIKAIQELRKTLELERYTGKRQVLEP